MSEKISLDSSDFVFLFAKEKLYSLITMNMDEQLAFSFLFIF